MPRPWGLVTYAEQQELIHSTQNLALNFLVIFEYADIMHISHHLNCSLSSQSLNRTGGAQIMPSCSVSQYLQY
jgi:hypothetical protein